jgi:integrase
MGPHEENGGLEMAERLTQGIINKVNEVHAAGTQLHDAETAGLRVVVGKASSSYKYMGRINDGSKRYVSIIIGRTSEVSLKTARDKAAELRLALRRGDDPRKPKASVPSIGEAFGRYLAGRGKELSPVTLNWYRQKIDGPLSCLRKTPADKVDREAVRALHEQLTKTTGPYGANGAMRVLKLVLNDVARTHDLPPNPVSRGVRMNKEKARDWAVGPDEMPKLWADIDAMEERTRRACWLLMLTTGLRSGNARSVRWEHLEGDVLFVPKAKSGRSFSLPLPAVVVQAISEIKELNAKLESPFVFPSATSKSGHIEVMKRTTNFPYAPHQMRHTYRTHALEAGIDFQSITMLMDHANTHVSFNYVTRAHLTGHLRECQDRIAERLLSFRGLSVVDV